MDLRTALAEFEEDYKKKTTERMSWKRGSVGTRKSPEKEQCQTQNSILQKLKALSDEYNMLAEEWKRESTGILRIPFRSAAAGQKSIQRYQQLGGRLNPRSKRQSEVGYNVPISSSICH